MPSPLAERPNSSAMAGPTSATTMRPAWLRKLIEVSGRVIRRKGRMRLPAWHGRCARSPGRAQPHAERAVVRDAVAQAAVGLGIDQHAQGIAQPPALRPAAEQDVVD